MRGSAAAIIYSVRGLSEQFQMTTFLEYTKRYGQIMASLPFEARQPDSDFGLSRLSEEERGDFLKTYRDYFNLCWEEWWLHGMNKIDHTTWGVWVEAMRQTMDFPCFDEAWKALKSEYDPYGDFWIWFEGVRIDQRERTSEFGQSDRDSRHATFDSLPVNKLSAR